MPIVLGIGPKSPPVIPAGTKGLTAGQAARIMPAPSYPQAFGFRYNIGSGYSGR